MKKATCFTIFLFLAAFTLFLPRRESTGSSSAITFGLPGASASSGRARESSTKDSLQKPRKRVRRRTRLGK
uniref:Putative secreted peptide n=1 Tax=Rhipicephalus pulchellus TaxID=72859 RepID=L7MCI1_RHIPC